MGKGKEIGTAGCCWCDRDERNQAVSWRALVIVSNLLLAVIEPKVAADLASETDVLLEMKRLWGNPPVLRSWSNDTLTCGGEWLGVTCDDLNTTIINLVLNTISIESTIPTVIGNLTNLTQLGLSSSGVTGEIPRTIGSLKSLTQLILGNNLITGSIPDELGNLTSLISLDLTNNNLTGTLPDLSRLQSLQYLDVGSNNLLTGPLPNWLGNLSQLQSLNLIFTNFTGSIPTEIGKLENLLFLDLTSCGMSGPLPPELGKLKSLFRMQMDSNHFTGSIPESFSNLQNLHQLILRDNQFNGFLTPWIGQLVSVDELSLDGNFFEGSIPPDVGTLSNLTKLNFGQNDLRGEIPDTLGNLKNLQSLDLSNNFLSGPVPSSILLLPDLSVLVLDNNCLNGSSPGNQSNINAEVSVAGNCFNGSSESCKCDLNPGVVVSPSLNGPTLNGGSNSNSKIYISVGVVVGSLLALGIFIVVFLRCRVHQKELPPAPGSVESFRLSTIREATNNFTNVIGKGGQATVYKAEFKDRRVAAIKRFGHDLEHRRRRNAFKNFDQEVTLLVRLNHRFLVNVIGYCQEEGEYMLLFEFMDMGSLYDRLHGGTSFTWEERVTIMICVASGIDYLHYGCSPPIFHRDIKSANILLSSEQKLIAKVADFGLGKLTTIEVEGDDIGFNVGIPKPDPTDVMGSHGYIDPNFLRTAIFSEKSDIYSFGVVLLELITGRRALEKGNIFMTEWVRQHLEEPMELPQIVDPKLEGKYVEEELVVVAEIARRCIELRPTYRPTIREVLQTFRTVFKKQTTMISPSQTISSSGVDFSGVESNFSGDVPIYSINGNTQSEILPRD